MPRQADLPLLWQRGEEDGGTKDPRSGSQSEPAAPRFRESAENTKPFRTFSPENSDDQGLLFDTLGMEAPDGLIEEAKYVPFNRGGG